VARVKVCNAGSKAIPPRLFPGTGAAATATRPDAPFLAATFFFALFLVAVAILLIPYQFCRGIGEQKSKTSR
jgi:hypothetical protein